MRNLGIISTIIRNHFGKYHPHIIMRESEEAAIAVCKYYEKMLEDIKLIPGVMYFGELHIPLGKVIDMVQAGGCGSQCPDCGYKLRDDGACYNCDGN